MPMPLTSCLLCGLREDDVPKMHYFTRNLERQKLWKESMGITHSGSLSRYRICCLHFTKECYTDETSFRLKPDAVPTLLPCRPKDVEMVESTKSVPQPKETSCTPLDVEIVPMDSTKSMLQPEETVTTGRSELVNEPVACSSRHLSLPPSTSYVRSESVACSLTHLTPPKSGSHVKRSLFKDIEGLSLTNTTPRKRKLIDLVKRKHDHIRKLKMICKQKRRSLKEVAKLNLESSEVVKNIFKGMSSSTTTFMMSQLRCARRLPKGRRWTTEDKILSLAIYKRSPKCYTLLRKLMTLPSRRTLTTLLEKIPFNAGINEHLFQHLGQCLKSTHEDNRLCTLMFDEMSIREHLEYDKVTDSIIGFEDLGGGRRSKKIANHALVFMAQGIRRNWKQPLAFYFTQGGISSNELGQILGEVLDAMERANLVTIATVCDMGSANVKTLKTMGSNVTRPYIEHNGRKIFNLFDICHLLKCLRNLLRKYNIRLPVELGEDEVIMEARWADIQLAHDVDKDAPTPFRSLRKLTDAHLKPIMQMAMKVKLAAQVMSSSVAAFIYTLVGKNVLPQRALGTATLTSQVDEMLDSLNGSAQIPPDGKPYCCVVTETSGHVPFWKKAFQTVQKWNIVRKPSDVDHPGPKPPSQVGWLQTLKAMPMIWDSLKNRLTYLRPRNFNQDALENLFGSIRSGCGSNENPTVGQFVSSLKTQIVNGLAKRSVAGTNCEEDDANLLSDLRSFIEGDTTSTPRFIGPETAVEYVSNVSTDIAESVSEGAIETLSVAYVSGYIAKRIFRDIDCGHCKNDLEGDPTLPCNQFILFKEFDPMLNKLTYPSENLVITVGTGITLLEENLSQLCYHEGLVRLTSDILERELDFSWLSCADHSRMVQHCIIIGLCRIGIPWYCKRIVRDLKDKKKATTRKMKKIIHQ